MKSKFFCLLFCSLFATISLCGAEPDIVVNNRILANVNGTAISVVDVMKKMDLYLNRAYPEHAQSTAHRFQFFSQNWKNTLNQMIDNELIKADAEKLELKITDADVRGLVHERFGPNVMASLDALGFTLDEAWRIIYSELVVQRMSWYRVHSKAFNRVSPQSVKEAYQEYVTSHPPKESWTYQTLSITAATKDLGEIYAQKANALIRKEPLPFEVLVQKLQEDKEDKHITVTLSEDYTLSAKDISQANKEILSNLTPNTYSMPVAQVSRFSNTPIYRIFYLKEHNVKKPPNFHAMVEPLQEELMQKELAKELPIYLGKLRKQFNFDEKFLEAALIDFQPFILPQDAAL